MKRRTAPPVSVLGFLCLIASLFILGTHVARADDLRTRGGMLAWPRAEMTHALDIVLPEKMRARRVPGISLAVVEDGKIVYISAFGTAGPHRQVTQATLFQAGEIGEVTAAYGAMTLVRDKLLFLDAPLSRDLPKRWLDDGDDNARVTLRQVLMQTSGLSDNTIYPSRTTRFTPGDHFARSGVGYLYLQNVMSAVERAPFEQVMQARVFVPLGMTSSGYFPEPHLLLSSGYVPLFFPLAAFYVPFAGVFLLGLFVTGLILRFTGARNDLELSDTILPIAAGIVAAFVSTWTMMGFAAMILILVLALLYALAVFLIGAAIFFSGRALGIGAKRDGVLMRGRETSHRTLFVVSAFVAVLASFPFLGRNVLVPILPFGEPPVPNAAMSFHTTAGDIARFMIGMMDGRVLGPQIQSRMLTDRVAIDSQTAWALGIGVRRLKSGETLWARGSVLGFESLIVMDPARRAGVVVLTNAREGAELTQEIARDVMGVDDVWTLP